MRQRCTSLFSRLLIAALVSGLAALLMVTVGPGFAEDPNEHASDRAMEATADDTEAEDSGDEDGSAANANAEGAGENSQAANSVTEAAANDDLGFGDNASDEPDSHGHIGAGTENTEGSQADPGHDPNENSQEKYQSNGDGLGDDPAAECTNDRHQGADAPQGGANYNPGPYDNTCDGRISQNGQGDDANGAGTPCAGCVGNADDRNPPGQVREFYGTKANDMGYECDGNQGVGAHYGNGNPAHTGDCAPSEEECVDNPDTTMDECNPGTEQVCRETSSGNWEVVTITEGTRRSTDRDADDEACEDEPDVVCRKVQGEWEIVNLPAGEDRKPGDRDADDEACADSPDSVCRETSPGNWEIVNLPAGEDRQPGDRNAEDKKCEDSPDSVCRETSPGNWEVVNLPAGEDRQPGDKNADHKNCDDDTEPDCLGHNPPHDNHGPDSPACQNKVKVWICHATGSATNPYVIIHVSKSTWEEDDGTGHAGHVNDFEVPEGTDKADCVEVDASCTDSPTTPYNDCQPLTICHKQGDMWRVDTIEPEDLGDYPGAKVVPPGTSPSSCETSTPTCPAGTDMAGLPIPPGGVDDCDDDNGGRRRRRDNDCPAGTVLAGQPMPSDGNCNPTVVAGASVTVCPLDSDRPVMVLPTGKTADWCYDDVLGTRHVFVPAPAMPAPDDKVKRSILRNRPVTRPERVEGGVLPFTGASVLAFLVLALQLIAAGSLILRGRRA